MFSFLICDLRLSEYLPLPTKIQLISKATLADSNTNFNPCASPILPANTTLNPSGKEGRDLKFTLAY
jgi:hypothetical protein